MKTIVLESEVIEGKNQIKIEKFNEDGDLIKTKKYSFGKKTFLENNRLKTVIVNDRIKTEILIINKESIENVFKNYKSENEKERIKEERKAKKAKEDKRRKKKEENEEINLNRSNWENVKASIYGRGGH
jgi:hypothetical protein